MYFLHMGHAMVHMLSCLSFHFIVIKIQRGRMPEAQACNPSDSGNRDQEDCGLKPTQANSSMRPYLEEPFTKIRLVEWLKVKVQSSNPSIAKNK
jgi:hypothetical protein